MKKLKSKHFKAIVLELIILIISIIIFIQLRENPNLELAIQERVFPVLGSLLFLIVGTLITYNKFLKKTSKELPVWFYPILSGGLSVLMLFTGYAYACMSPLGDKTLLTIDLYHQYTPILINFLERVLHGGSILYTFNMGIGANFIPILSYYIMSPLNLILTLFQRTTLNEGLVLIEFIRFALTSAFMTLFIERHFKKNTYTSTLIGIMYGFSAHMIAYSSNIMWQDSLMMLPLCILTLENLIDNKKCVPYVIVLFITILLNYYIGFMICIFLFIYGVGHILINQNLKDGLNSLMRFLISSLIGGCLTAFILVPTYMALSNTSAVGDAFPDLIPGMQIYELITRTLVNESPTIRSGNLPNIYSGLLILIGIPAFILNDNIPKKKRVVYTGILLIITLSLILKPLDIIWHGLHSPNDFPYRYEFLFSFIALLITGETINEIKGVKPQYIKTIVIVLIAFLILTEHLSDIGDFSTYVNGALIIYYGYILFSLSKENINPNVAVLGLLLLSSLELTMNASKSFKTIDQNEIYVNKSNYLSDDISTGYLNAIREIEENENSLFYRLELTPRRAAANAMLYNYRGVTMFSSSADYNLVKFLRDMGYTSNGINSISYENYVPTIDSLLGIKYYSTNENPIEYPFTEEYRVEEEGDTTITTYKNTTALPLGFMVNTKIDDWGTVEKSPFKNQNTLYHRLIDIEEDIFERVELSAVYPTNLTIREDGNFTFENSSSIKMRTLVQETGNYFVYVNYSNANTVRVKTDYDYYDIRPSQPYVINTGVLNEGDYITIDIESKFENDSGYVYVYKLNEQAYEEAYNTLNSSTLNVTTFKTDYIEGDIDVKNDGTLLTSIPYEEEWTVYVDGTKVKTDSLDDSLLAINLTEGHHNITFKYRPKGVTLGIIISVVSLIVGLILQFTLTKKRSTN